MMIPKQLGRLFWQLLNWQSKKLSNLLMWNIVCKFKDLSKHIGIENINNFENSDYLFDEPLCLKNCISYR